MCVLFLCFLVLLLPNSQRFFDRCTNKHGNVLSPMHMRFTCAILYRLLYHSRWRPCLLRRIQHNDCNEIAASLLNSFHRESIDANIAMRDFAFIQDREVSIMFHSHRNRDPINHEKSQILHHSTFMMLIQDLNVNPTLPCGHPFN